MVNSFFSRDIRRKNKQTKKPLEIVQKDLYIVTVTDEVGSLKFWYCINKLRRVPGCGRKICIVNYYHMHSVNVIRNLQLIIWIALVVVCLLSFMIKLGVNSKHDYFFCELAGRYG